MRNLALGFTVPVKPPLDEEYDIPALIETIQQFVFQRRLRVKDAFRDFDQLRCGRCTRQQFMRGVNTTMASLRKDELEALADYYTEEGAHVQRPQVVGYSRFVAAVEEIFTVAHLEKQPTRKVPRAGATLSHVFRPNTVGVDREEARIQAILQKIALLCKTRGIIFLSCFQDCDRSDAISLVTPRYSGKATQSQFRQHFPLIADFEESELRFLAKRYTTPGGDINYQALNRDIKEAEKQVPPPSGAHAPSERVPQTPYSPVGGKRVSAERTRRDATLQQTRQSIDVMDKLNAVVSERRLRLVDCFLDFDKLRKGVCTMNHVQTVFTVLGIEMGPREFKNLDELFSNEDGLFRYRDFCTAVCDIHQQNITSYDMELPPASPSTPRGERRPGSSIRYRAPLSPLQLQQVAELETKIGRRADVWSLNLKKAFRDFDKTCMGHVTRNQFHRIMNMMNYEFQPWEGELLCQAYCDTDNGDEVNYIDFCDSVQTRMRTPRESDMNSNSAYAISRRPKYFDRTGEYIMAYTPLDVTASSFKDTESKIPFWQRVASR
jgi:Ca2+-binding EF-hand superfamily protein